MKYALKVAQDMSALLKKRAGKEDFELPADHVPGVKVPKGGSCCANCKYGSVDDEGQGHCANKYFQKWNGSDLLPQPADEFCSDWWEHKE